MAQGTGGRVRAPAPTAYPKVRLIFCRARCPHRAVPGRPGVPPLRNAGIFRFGRRGRRPRRPAGAHCAPLRRPPAILWFLSHRWERNSPRRAKPCETARRVVAPYRRRSLPGGRPHGAAPTKNPNQGGFTEKKNPGAAWASPRPTGFFLRRLLLKMPPHPSGLAASHLPYPLCRFATSPLDKGSRPTRGRLF